MKCKYDDKIAVLDFGGQYAHLIANRIRRLGVYSEIVPSDITAEELACYKGIILSGSPFSVLQKGNPTFDPALLKLGLPVLGLCYGHQLLAKTLGGVVTKGTGREYGKAVLNIAQTSPLFDGLSLKESIWMSHGDMVECLPDGFILLGSTPDCPNAAVGDIQKKLYGLQFHPEVTDTPCGMKILENFIAICGCAKNWNSYAFLIEIKKEILRFCKNKRVFLLVSGGVDSTVVFALLNEALGSDRVVGLHIDNGLMRYRESNTIMEYMKTHGFHNLRIVDASKDFLNALKGVINPEEKRTIIGNLFIKVKERAFEGLGLNSDEWILAQGTIYPDTIESAGTKHADKIKTHHNRVDVVLDLIAKGLVIEPLAQLYKDEVRALGEELGLPRGLIWRHPFPGPGLGVRVLCSDGIVHTPEVSHLSHLRSITEPDGYSSVILPVRSVGVQGDERSYAHPALLTGPCDWNLLEEISTKITNSMPVINRVVYGLKVSGSSVYKLIPAEITYERLEKLRAVDNLITEILYKTGEYDAVWQMPVVLLPLVNEQGGECVVLRPIVSQEAMTARFAPLGEKTIKMISEKTSSVKGVGDLFFDITHKPPATIEWE